MAGLALLVATLAHPIRGHTPAQEAPSAWPYLLLGSQRVRAPQWCAPALAGRASDEPLTATLLVEVQDLVSFIGARLEEHLALNVDHFPWGIPTNGVQPVELALVGPHNMFFIIR